MVFYPSSLARGSERSRNGGADRTLKTIQKRETRKKRGAAEKRTGSGTREGGSGREAGDAAKDSEDSKEFSVEGKGNRKGNLDRDIEGLNTRV